MSSTTLTIKQLCLSPFNVRTNQQDATATSALEASILARGLILPLIVHPMRGAKNKWGVYAGGRRYRSIKALVGRGQLPEDFPVDVVIRDLPEAELIEVSAAENLLRRDLRPYELFAAVANANRKGDSPAKIAETLGQEISWVRQSLRLGNLARPIFEALEAEEISLDQARAYGATEDQALQLAAFEAMKEQQPAWRGAAQIRGFMKVGDREAMRLLRFVGADAYHAAGGELELDLFADGMEERGRIKNPELLRQLADDRLQGLRDDTRRRTGRDIRFLPDAPKNDFGTDWSLQVTPKQGDGDAIVIPEGDIVATIVIPETGDPDVSFWWSSRKAKHGIDRVIKPGGQAIEKPLGLALSGPRSPAALEADRAIKEDNGLTQESVDIFRSVRRAILRAALVDDARADRTFGADFLVWSQLRMLLDGHAYSMHIGASKLQGGSPGPDSAREHIAANPSMKVWGAAFHELSTRPMISEPDLAVAFRSFTAEPPARRNLAAAVVAGMSLERSLNADGYRLPVHDALATMLGLYDDADIRRYWTPTAELLDRIPVSQRLAIAEPYVESVTFGAWARLKASEITRNVLTAVTGTAPWLRHAHKDEAANWVHPLLRFSAAAEADVREAAE